MNGRATTCFQSICGFFFKGYFRRGVTGRFKVLINKWSLNMKKVIHELQLSCTTWHKALKLHIVFISDAQFPTICDSDSDSDSRLTQKSEFHFDSDSDPMGIFSENNP